MVRIINPLFEPSGVQIPKDVIRNSDLFVFFFNGVFWVGTRKCNYFCTAPHSGTLGT